MVVLGSNITIGNFQFTGVNQVTVNRSIHSVRDKAVIEVPSKALVCEKNKPGTLKITADQFNEGDPVTILLGYDGDLRQEFVGFVTTKGMSMPLKITCEGYCRQLRLNNNITGHYKSTSAKELLQLAVQGTDIAIDVQDDVPLNDIKLVSANGEQICDYIKQASEETLTIYFKDPKTLWCGLVYTPYAQGTDILNMGTVSYQLGYNCIRDNGLQVRDVLENPVQVLFGSRLATGKTTFTSSQLVAAKRQLKRLLEHVGSEDYLKRFAQEKEYHLNYTGYQGKLEGFLQPYALPGYSANITDSRYPQLDGTYLIESTEVTFGTNGARRLCEIGPRLKFAA